MTKNIKEQIAEVNRDIKEGLSNWADICLVADADGWSEEFKYDVLTIVDAVFIFQHVLSNYGIKAGKIDEKAAKRFGNRLRKLVIDMTGEDPHRIMEDVRIAYGANGKA